MKLLTNIGEHLVRLNDKYLFNELSWAITYEVMKDIDDKFYREVQHEHTGVTLSMFSSFVDANDNVIENVDKAANALFILDGVIYARVAIEGVNYWTAYAEGENRRGRIIINSTI